MKKNTPTLQKTKIVQKMEDLFRYQPTIVTEIVRD